MRHQSLSNRYRHAVKSEFEVPVPGGSLRGWVHGEGPPVLVLHGGPGLSEYMESLVPELEDAFTVIRFQQRGVAPSTPAWPFDVPRHVADTLAVLDAVGVERGYVIGHSWGGHLAMHLAVQHQHRLLGLVIVDPIGAVGDGGASDLNRIVRERLAPGPASRANELTSRLTAGEGTKDDHLEFLAIAWPCYFSSPEKAPPMPEMDWSMQCFEETNASVREHLEKKTLASLLPTVEVPTVFLMGAESPIPPHHGVASAELIPGATYRIEEDCGHFVWLERPGSVRRALESLVQP